ncbi:uncharacterized protein LOC124157157 [Ischnura elegans]|uniref:uncharacterized protein LOC124157157 n=1 Tax=Ischnura elegans TaxID=197161 RepID=UPI001ED86A5F|nr:uncharacterized protein LOC124157157 [Ischnura elegans]
MGPEETQKFLFTLSDDELKEFLYSCIDELSGKKGPALLNLQSRSQYSKNDFKELVTNVCKMCYDCIALNLDLDKVKEKYPILSLSQCNVLNLCITNRKSEIIPNANLNRVGKTENLLKDYDWKLKWVIGSSTFSALHEPLLALDLHLESGKENTAMNLELDKTELKHLIEALEKAQQSMCSHLNSA